MESVYLKELNSEELNVIKSIPALITILVGSSDGNLDEKEIHMGKVSTEYRKHNGEPLVQDYFEWVSEDFSSIFEQEWNRYKELSSETRTQQVSDEISKVNNILHKIDKKYAHALVVSWRGLSRAVANASGGILGRLTVSAEELETMGLDMIELH